MYNLGLMYENGKGVEQNYQKAIELYQKGANLGHSSCIFLTISSISFFY